LYGKYNIILFENNKKKKLIKKYNTLKNAIKKYNTLLNDNKKIIFEKQVQNFNSCTFFLGLITKEKKTQESIFLTDELGRNVPVNLNNSDYVFLELKNYKIEETLYDWQTEKKITLLEFLKQYLNGSELKNISGSIAAKSACTLTDCSVKEDQLFAQEVIDSIILFCILLDFNK
jgi:hypothetical protein